MQSKWNTKILNDHRLGSEEICICHITSFVLFKKWKEYCSNTTLTIFHLQGYQISKDNDKIVMKWLKEVNNFLIIT